MMHLVHAEAARLVRHPINRAVLCALAIILLLSAVWSGLAARDHRHAAQAQLMRWDGVLNAERAKALAEASGAAASGVAAAADGSAQALRTFQLGRHDAAIAPLPGLGGLVLSVRQFDRLSPELRVSIEGRHVDARKNDVLTNPLLGGLGALDFATVMALLLPLALIGLAYGLVLEDRETGLWRWVCVQCTSPVWLVVIALALRAAAALGIAAVASIVAFALDPGATFGDAIVWVLAIALYGVILTAIVGAFLIPAWSVATATLALIGLWLSLTFAIPAGLATLANRDHPMPSRLAAITDMRDAQQHAESHMDALVTGWYEAHPETKPPGRNAHTWPVSFIPRFLAQDETIRPVMRAFDTARAQQTDHIERRAWMSPPLALVLLADRLAGIDAQRYLHYVMAVDRHEDAWRDALVPKVMGYRGLSAADIDALPRFDVDRWRASLEAERVRR